MTRNSGKSILFILPLLLGLLSGVLFMEMRRSAAPVANAQTNAVAANIQAAVSIQDAFRSVARSVTPAVVNISSETVVRNEGANMPEDPFMEFFGKDFFNQFFDVPREYKERSLGTGFLVSADGFLISNFHVIRNATKIMVTLADGAKYKARVVGADPKTDIALLKIDAKGLAFVKTGDSDTVEVGDWAIAIGNPFGLSETFTVGVISAKGRKDVGIGDFENYLQTDAAINPGNSGGPLVNIEGEVIGVNTAIASPSGGNVGIGFAIPINTGKSVFDQLKATGKVVRGWTGLYIQDLTEDIAKPLKLQPNSGVLVADVIKGGPAEAAGLKTGDIVVEFNSKQVRNADELKTLVASSPVGKTVALKVLRAGKPVSFELKIAEMPAETESMAPVQQEQKWLGLLVSPLTADLKQKYGISPADNTGVVITSVDQNSVSAEAGLKEGDLLVSINNAPLKTLKDFSDLVSADKTQTSFLFLVKRQDRLFYIGIDTEQ